MIDALGGIVGGGLGAVPGLGLATSFIKAIPGLFSSQQQFIGRPDWAKLAGISEDWWQQMLTKTPNLLFSSPTTILSLWNSQRGQQGTGETPTEGTGGPQGTLDVGGTGEGVDVSTTIVDIVDSNQMSWAEKAAALGALGVSAAALPYLLGPEPTWTTTVSEPTQPGQQQQSSTPYDVAPVTGQPQMGDPTFYGYGWPWTPPPYDVAPIEGQPSLTDVLGGGVPYDRSPLTVNRPEGPTVTLFEPPPAPWTVPYDPAPIMGTPQVSIPPINIPAPSGATQSPGAGAPKSPDVGDLLSGLGGAASGGGAGLPGPAAPVVGGGQSQSAFGLPGVTTPPPTLAQFLMALRPGVWRQ